MMQLISVEPSFIHYENLGTARIKAYLQELGIDVKLSVLFVDKDLGEEFEKIDLDKCYFGFSAYSMCIEFIHEICKKIKTVKHDAITFVGGRYATMSYDVIVEQCLYIDFVVLGHGEYPIHDLIKKSQQGITLDDIIRENPHIASKQYNANKEECYIDLNTLPWPTREYLEQNKDIWYAYICDSHGCLARCSFCAYHRQYRTRPAQDLIDEMNSIYIKTGVCIFYMMGGSFEDPGPKGKRKIRELCDLLLVNPYRFGLRCYLRAESFKDDHDYELLVYMKKAGFVTVFVGIEAANQEDLNLYNKRSVPEDNRRIFKMLSGAGIYHNDHGFIMFNLFSTYERLEENYNFLCDSGCVFPQYFISKLLINHNSLINYTLKNQNMLLDDKVLGWNKYNFVHKEIDELWQFIENNLMRTDPSKTIPGYDFINMKYQYFVEFVYFYHYLLDLGDDFTRFTKSLEGIAKLNKDFFGLIYVKRDLQAAQDALPEYVNKMKENDEICMRIVRKLLYKALRLRKENSKKMSIETEKEGLIHESV
jgi:anaerobic magnesium-protoporphyrin IX monomethyl ester cyclase